jgi:tetratricopeptide (TPR) repeat protein
VQRCEFNAEFERTQGHFRTVKYQMIFATVNVRRGARVITYGSPMVDIRNMRPLGYTGALVLRTFQIALLAALISPIASSQDSAGGPQKIETVLADLDDELRRIEALLKELSPILKSPDAGSSIKRAEAALNLLTSQEAYQRGRIAEESRQYVAAIDAFGTAVQLDPANDSALLHRGRAYLELGKLDSALADLNRSLAVQPNSSRAYELRASVHRALKEYDQAIADLQAAAKLDPNNAAHVLSEAAIAEDRGDIPAAIELYSQALSRNPSSVEIRLKRAAAFTKANRFEESLKDCTGTIELQPSSAAGYLCRAEVYLRLRQVQPAIGDLDQAMRLNPLALEAGPVISALWREIQLREVAQQASTVSGQVAQQPVRDISTVTPHPVPAATTDEPPHQSPGPVAAPVLAVSRPAVSEPGQSPAAEATDYIRRGRGRIAQNRYREAVADLSKAIDLDPSSAEAYNARGYAYLREHEYPQAIADFTSAIRLNLKYANAYLNRGVARKLAGDAQGAKGDLQIARMLAAELQNSPKSPEGKQIETIAAH